MEAAMRGVRSAELSGTASDRAIKRYLQVLSHEAEGSLQISVGRRQVGQCAPPILKDWANDLYPISKPDVLKLARAAEDALTGIIWSDDALIVQEHLYKAYDATPGLLLSVQSMDLITRPARPAINVVEEPGVFNQSLL
jgi:Holliday junction resolvase RusA-like endonuclease